MKILAIRTKEGHYLEFATIRANLEDGSEIAIDLSEAVFVELLNVPDIESARIEIPHSNGNNTNREPRTIRIDGAGGIKSEESVKGLG